MEMEGAMFRSTCRRNGIVPSGLGFEKVGGGFPGELEVLEIDEEGEGAKEGEPVVLVLGGVRGEVEVGMLGEPAEYRGQVKAEDDIAAAFGGDRLTSARSAS
jgi:hypothetical protein